MGRTRFELQETATLRTAGLILLLIATSVGPAMAAQAGKPSALEADWLFQAGGRPSVAAALQEIAWARDLARRLARLPEAPDLSVELVALGSLAKQLRARSDPKAADALATQLYLAVRRVKRRIAFKNPAVDFRGVLLVDNPYPSGREWPHQSRHRNGFMATGA